MGFQIKIDRWVDYFASKMKLLGEGTLKATGTVLRATGDVLSSPFRKKEEASSTK